MKVPSTFESLWVTFPAACGVSPGHDQRLHQEARPRLPEAPREPPIGSLPKYLAACGGDPLLPTACGECVTSCALRCSGPLPTSIGRGSLRSIVGCGRR